MPGGGMYLRQTWCVVVSSSHSDLREGSKVRVR